MGSSPTCRLLLAALICAPGCDEIERTEVARVAQIAARNRILSLLGGCAPECVEDEGGIEPVFIVKVPQVHLASALELLRIYGFDREAPKPPEAGGMFSGSDNEIVRRALESERIACAIRRALEEDTRIVSVSPVVHLAPPRKSDPRLADSKHSEAAMIGSASIVLRAILDTTEREAETARIVAMAERVLKGQGLAATGVDVIVLPPLPTLPTLPAATPASPVVADVLPDSGEGRSRVLAYSLIANALCGLIVILKILGSLRRRGAEPAKVAALSKSVTANKPARGAA